MKPYPTAALVRLLLVLFLLSSLTAFPVLGSVEDGGARVQTQEDPAVPSASPGTADPIAATRVLDVTNLVGLDDLIERIAETDVVFVGETHDNYADHLNQLAIIQGLHERDRPLAIGMEFFQQPFQSVLDAYIAGEASEAEMLKQTEYFERWRFDYRLYRPILRYAKDEGIPLIALNVPKELTAKVGDQGLDGLSAEERAALPAELDASDPAYRARVKAVFDQHPKGPDADFEHFLAVQLLWDEGMAERAADYLAARPGTQLVVLAGSGHIEFGQGIPKRLERRRALETVTVLNGAQHAFAPGRADFLLFPQPVGLPPAGLLGVMLDSTAEGEGMRIQGLAAESGARDAGVEVGDRLVKIGERPIEDYADVRIALIDGEPGDRLPVEVLRSGLIGGPERLRFEVELH